MGVCANVTIMTKTVLKGSLLWFKDSPNNMDFIFTNMRRRGQPYTISRKRNKVRAHLSHFLL